MLRLREFAASMTSAAESFSSSLPAVSPASEEPFSAAEDAAGAAFAASAAE